MKKWTSYTPELERFGKGRSRRKPAIKIPVEAHQQIGHYLKTIRKWFFAQKRFNRSAVHHLDTIRCTLDDWLATEYSQAELPNEIFFSVYYRSAEAPTATNPKCALDEAKAILEQHYGSEIHDFLGNRFDRVAKALPMTYRITVYAYRTPSGRYGFTEAVSYRDAQRYLGSRARIYRRDLDPVFYIDAQSNRQLKAAIFHGATTLEEALAWIRNHGIKAVPRKGNHD